MVPLIDLHIEGKCEMNTEMSDVLIRKTLPVSALNRVPASLGDGLKWPFLSQKRFQDYPVSLTLSGKFIAGVWAFLHTVYAMVGWVIVSLSILTFSGLLRQKEHKT